MRALSILSVLYLAVLPVSLGAMEIAAPLLAVTALILSLYQRFTGRSWQVFQWSLPVGFWALMGLYFIAFLGVLLNDLPLPNAIHGVGKLRWIILYFFLHNIFTNIDLPERLPRYLLNLSPLIIAVGFFAFTQYWTGYDPIRGDDFKFPIATRPSADFIRYRSIGFFNGTLTYGYVFTGLSCLLAALFLGESRKGQPRLKILGQALGILFLFLSIGTTYARGVWLSLLAGFGVMFWKSQRRFLLFSGLALTLGLAAYLPFDTELQDRLKSFTDPKYTSNLERLKLWQANFEMFKDSPLIGVGYDYNDQLVGQYFDRLAITDAPKSHAHNTYLQFLSGTGILGLVCFLAFLFSLFRATRSLVRTSADSYLYLGILGLHTSVLVGGLTECNFKDAEVNHMFIYFAAVVSAAFLQSQRSTGLLSHRA